MTVQQKHPKKYKKIVLHLFIAHLLALLAGLLFGAGLQTLLLVYAFQALAVLLIICFKDFAYDSASEKFSAVVTFLMFSLFIAFTIFIIWITSKKGVVIVNDVQQTIHMGKLSVYAVSIGTLTFVTEYWQNHGKYLKKVKQKNDPFGFFKIFTRVASLILITTVAFSFESSVLALCLITLTKFILDIGQEWFDRLAISFYK